MPIRDALRTSILSKKWRYRWTGIPKLVFDDKLVALSSGIDVKTINTYKLVNAILHVLLQHRGPISELCICISDASIVNEIDQIIIHLSRSQNIKKFKFEMSSFIAKIPCSLFSLQGLEYLSLKFCIFELPLMFNGFSMLKSLIIYIVDISATMLQRFLTGCPQLEEFSWIGYSRTEFTFVELFKCLPSVQAVNISWSYIKHFAAVGMPQKLPTTLVHLRILVLDDVWFHKPGELSSTLCVINSCPNLEKIKIMMVCYEYQSFTTLLDSQDYFGLNLDHLKEVEITSFHSHAPEMEFVKLIMAKSPVLKKARIELYYNLSVDEENKMLRDLLHFSHLRASPAAKFIIHRP